ncbi:tape measure protein [Aeromonas veronii]|uniref:tape measure protein n=1 Tax=Aeromonas veronii TaxID=654 RepID=UPI00301B8F3C
MSTSSTLKLALELAAKVTGREDLAALAGEVQELGPISDETAAETAQLAESLESLSRQQALIQQFNDSKAALTQLELATVLSRDKLEQLRREQQAGAGDAKALAEQERLLTSEVKQLERQLVAQSASHTRLHAGLKQSGLDTKNLAQEQQRLQRELTKSVAQTERLGRELSQGSQDAGGFQGAIGSLTGRLVAMAGTWFGIQTLTSQLMAMFQTGDQAERLDVQLKAVMGSIAGGKEASAWIQDFAKNTPLQLSEVTQVFVRLKAFGIDPMAGAMQGIVDQAFKLGGGFEEVQGISLALGQAWAKQKLQGEEILQLIERGVPVWQMLEQVTGKNTAELQKLSEAGKLGRETISALMNEIATQSRGAAADNMSLLSGLISNAQDNLAKFYRMVAESGALAWLKNQLANLNAEFDRMANDGRLQEWAQRLSDGFISMGETLKSLIQTLYEWRTALTVLAQAWVGLKIAGWIGDLRGLYAQFIAMPVATATAAGGMTTAGTAAAAASIGVRALGLAVKGLLAAVTVESIIQITQFASALRQLVQAELALREAQALRSETQARLNGQFAALSTELGFAITSMADLDRLVAEGKVHYDEATGSWQKGAAAVKALGDEAKSTRDYLAEINAVAKQTAADGPAKLAEAFKVLGLDFEQANGRIGEGFQQTIGALDVLVAHTGASSAAIEEALAAAYNSAKTTAEIDAVIERQKQLAAQGKITGDALARSMAIATDAMAKVKGGSGDAKQAVAAIGDGFDEAAARAKGATDAMRAGLKGVQDEAKQTNASLASSGGGGGRSDITRTVNAGSFYYKSVDLNSLRGNAEGLANTLAGVEEELARYSQKVKDIPAYSEWSKYYGEKFQKEMEAMQARLKEELDKAQAKELEKSATPAAPVPVSTLPQVQTPTAPVTRQLQPIVIQLGERSARIDVAQEQVTGLLDVLRRYQEGQT